MTIRMLQSIVSPPVPPVETGDSTRWTDVESQLGIQLPDDYKAFIASYGSGNLAGFIHVFNPFSNSPHLSLTANIEKINAVYRHLRTSEGEKQVPYDVFPLRPGLLPWGRNEFGNYMFWLTKGSPDKWPIVLAEGRSDHYERYSMTMTKFLVKALRRELGSHCWPDEVPADSDPIVFYPQKVAAPKRRKTTNSKRTSRKKPE